MRRQVSFKDLKQNIDEIEERAYQLRSVAVLCQAAYCYVDEVAAPEHPHTRRTEDALLKTLDLLADWSDSLHGELDKLNCSLGAFAAGEGAFKSVDDHEKETLTQALVILRGDDSTSKALETSINAAFQKIQDWRDRIDAEFAKKEQAGSAGGGQ